MFTTSRLVRPEHTLRCLVMCHTSQRQRARRAHAIPRNALHAYPDDNAHKGPAQVVRQVSLVSTVRYQGELSRLCGTLRIVFPPTHTHPESYFRMADYTPSEGRGLIYGQCTYTGHIY